MAADGDDSRPESSYSGSTCPFLNLPQEIYERIVFQLKVSHGPLFIPTSIPDTDSDESRFQKKNRECYGERTPDQVQCSEGLLNWSSTCRYFREMLMPLLARTVILRTRSKSVRSVKSLSKSKYWSHVREFVFQTTDEWLIDATDTGLGKALGDASEETYLEREEREERTATLRVPMEMDELGVLFDHLPPNLSSLTLDFPVVWRYPWDLLNLDEQDYFDDEPGLLHAEKTDRYRALLYTVFDRVCKYDLSDKSNFALRLYNVPPFRCSIFEQQRFWSWLRQCSEFHMAMCNDSSLSKMNTHDCAGKFASKLGEWFLKHLDSVQTLRLHADESWPLGLAPGHLLLELPLPGSLQHLAAVKHVSFREMFICPVMVDFLVARAEQLVSIEMIDCYAGGLLHVESSPTIWAQFFNTLADAKFEKLTRFSIRHVTRKFEKFFSHAAGYDCTEEDIALVDGVIARQREEEIEALEQGASKEDVLRRRRWLFRYCTLYDKHGDLDDCANISGARFLMGEDYDAYTRLIEMVEENMTREGMVFRQTHCVALPAHPDPAGLIEMAEGG